jgi:hypothetical protein
MILYCTQCGTHHQVEDKFCGKCGQKTRVDSLETPAEISQASYPAAGSILPSSEKKDAVIDFIVDTQPLLLPLEKIELQIDGVPHPRTFKFGQGEKIPVTSGIHKLQAVLKVAIIKRTSDVLEVNFQLGSTKKILLDYNNITGGIKLVV